MLGSDPLVASTKVKSSKSLFNMVEYLMQCAEIGNVGDVDIENMSDNSCLIASSATANA